MPPRQYLSDEELAQLSADAEGPSVSDRASGFWEGLKSLGPFGGAAAGIRGLSGFLSPIRGGPWGAAFGAGAEGLAQTVENIPRIAEAFSPETLSDVARGLRDYPRETAAGFGKETARSLGRVGVEAALGAVPFGNVMKEGRAVGSAVRGAGMAGGGQAAHEAVNVAVGDEVDPNAALKRILFGTAIGGGVTGAAAGINRLAMGPQTPRAGGPTEQRTYEVVPTAAVGGEVGVGGKRTRVLPIRPQTATVQRPRVSQEVTSYRMDEPINLSTQGADLADDFQRILRAEERGTRGIPYLGAGPGQDFSRSIKAEAIRGAAGTRAQAIAERAAAARARIDERQRANVNNWIRARQAAFDKQAEEMLAADQIAAAKSGRTPEVALSETISAPIPGGKETMRTRFVEPDPDAGVHRTLDAQGNPIEGGGAPIRPLADTPQGQLYDAMRARGVDHNKAFKIASASSSADALRRLEIVNRRNPQVQPEEPITIERGPVQSPPTSPAAVETAALFREDVDKAERSFLLRLLMADLGENPFIQGGSTAAQRAEAMANWRPGDPSYLKHGFVPAPHQAGTPILGMLQAAGIAGSRPSQLETLRNALMGTGRNRQVNNLIQAMREAWDGSKFDWNMVSQETIDALGMRRRDFQTPNTWINLEEFDPQTMRGLERFYPELRAPKAEDVDDSLAAVGGDVGTGPVEFLEDVAETATTPTQAAPGTFASLIGLPSRGVEEGAAGPLGPAPPRRFPPKRQGQPRTLSTFEQRVNDILAGVGEEPTAPRTDVGGAGEPPRTTPPPPVAPEAPEPSRPTGDFSQYRGATRLAKLLGLAQDAESAQLSGGQARGGMKWLYDEAPTTPARPTDAPTETPVEVPPAVTEDLPEIAVTPPAGAVTTIPLSGVARNPLDAIAAQYARTKEAAAALGKRDKSPLAEILRARRSKGGAQLQNVARAYPEWSNIPEVRGQAPSVSRESEIVQGALVPRETPAVTRRIPAEPTPAPAAPPVSGINLGRAASQDETEAFLKSANGIPKTAAGRTKTVNALVDLRNHEGMAPVFDRARDLWTALNDRIAKLDPGSPEVAELYRAQNELATQIGNVARYASTAIKKGLEPTGPQITDAMTRLGKDMESLSQTGQLAARGKKGGPDIGGQSGAANIELLTMLAGGLGGAALDPLGNPILSGLLGAGAGYAAPRVIAKAADIKDRLPETNDEWREGVLSAAEKIPQYQRANLLTQSMSGTSANTFAGPYGAGVTAAIEGMLKGDPRAAKLWQETRNPIEFFKRWREMRPEAERALASGEEGRAEGLAWGPEGSRFDQLTSQPGLWMLQGDLATKEAARRAGYSLEEAADMTLTGEAKLPWFRAYQNLAKSPDPGSPNARAMRVLTDLLNPFKRTPANIGEAGLYRTPGVGAFFGAIDPGRSWRDVAVEQGLGTAAAGIGYNIGEELDPETARTARRFATNLSGRYSVPMGLGMAFGQAKARTGEAADALNARNLPRTVGDVLPLPGVDPLADLLGFFMGDRRPPRGLVPGQEYISALQGEPDIRETLEGIPPLSRYRSR